VIAPTVNITPTATEIVSTASVTSTEATTPRTDQAVNIFQWRSPIPTTCEEMYE
jgi:hypothetical protein